MWLTWGISTTPKAEAMSVSRNTLHHELHLSGSERLKAKARLGVPPLRCSVRWSLENHLGRNPKVCIHEGGHPLYSSHSKAVTPQKSVSSNKGRTASPSSPGEMTARLLPCFTFSEKVVLKREAEEFQDSSSPPTTCTPTKTGGSFRILKLTEKECLMLYAVADNDGIWPACFSVIG